ncbi:hypothetical protein H0E87_016173 [Populus deltoides]|uniref:Uncharacterized protein n=1 Tax=Populus deltoides TaxID=3696 RepID=A0A8T2Y7Y4_POPDE|nr:hypothetical protein H0E87_016173 [Populus deltoides]
MGSNPGSEKVPFPYEFLLPRNLGNCILRSTFEYGVYLNTQVEERGVRREVGNHAKALNKVLLKTEVNSMVSIRDDLIDSQQATEQNLGPLLSKEGRPFSPNSTNSHLLLETANKTRQTGQILVSPSIIAAEEGTAKNIGAAFSVSKPPKILERRAKEKKAMRNVRDTGSTAAGQYNDNNIQDKVPDAAGRGGPVIGAGKDENKKGLELLATANS